MKPIYFLLLGLLMVGCDAVNSAKTSKRETVRVMLLNPSNDDLEIRFYDHQGWSFKKMVTAGATDTIRIDADTFRLAVKRGDEFVSYFPSLDLEPTMAYHYSDFGWDINQENGDTSLAYVFHPKPWTKNYKAMYFVDLTFDSTKMYAVADCRWLYGGKSLESITDFERNAKASQKEGYPIVASAFRGHLPRKIPLHTRFMNSKLPESINVSYGMKGSVMRLHSVPLDERGNVTSYVFNEIVKETLSFEENNVN